MKTELLALIENYGKALVHQTEGKISAFKDAKNLMSNIVFMLDKAEQEEAAIGAGGVERLRGAPVALTPAEYPPLPRPAWNAKTIRATEDAFSADQMRAHYDLGRAARAQAPAADLINKIIQGCCESDIAAPGYIDTISISVSDLRGVLECNIEGSQAPVAKCETCNDNGLIGGPSFYDPGEGGVPCPDCSAPAAVEPVAWRYHCQGDPVRWYFSDTPSLLGLYEPLYAAPTTKATHAPVEVAVPDSISSLTGDAALAHEQCRAVVHLALAVAEVYSSNALIVANDARLADQIGAASAEVMEYLGDTLNSTDATTEEDEWLEPIFEAAQERWPAATQAAPADAPMVNMSPPATTRDRWMYEQGRLAEREIICAAIKAEDDHCSTGDYMLDSDDCIKVARGQWERPDYKAAAAIAAQAAQMNGGA